MAGNVAIVPGTAFWPRPTDDCEKPHPWVVLAVANGVALAVNLTDQSKHPELNVIVEKTEYAPLTKRSAAWFQKFQEIPTVLMGKELTSGEKTVHLQDVSSGLLTRLFEGLKADRNVRDAIKIKYGFLPANPTLKKPF